jgi:hypothetical protein
VNGVERGLLDVDRAERRRHRRVRGDLAARDDRRLVTRDDRA